MERPRLHNDPSFIHSQLPTPSAAGLFKPPPPQIDDIDDRVWPRILHCPLRVASRWAPKATWRERLPLADNGTRDMLAAVGLGRGRSANSN